MVAVACLAVCLPCSGAGLPNHATAFSRSGQFVVWGPRPAVAGPIAFVGLVIPHLCRLLVGADYRWILAFSVVLGAALLVGSDVVGRVITRPAEVEVGIITAIIGAPFFVWIVRRTKVRDL